MKNISFKPRAYEKAADFIKSIDAPLSEIYNRGGLKALIDLPAIGVSMAENLSLSGKKLLLVWKKPFDIVAKRPKFENGGDGES